MFDELLSQISHNNIDKISMKALFLSPQVYSFSCLSLQVGKLWIYIKVN